MINTPSMFTNYKKYLQDNFPYVIAVTGIAIVLVVLAVILIKTESGLNFFSDKVPARKLGIVGEQFYSKEYLKNRDAEAEKRKIKEIEGMDPTEYRKGQDFANKFSNSKGTFTEKPISPEVKPMMPNEYK